MSRIGKRPIPVLDGVQVHYNNRDFTAKGPKGEIKMNIHKDVDLELNDGIIQLTPSATKGITPMLGTTWALVQNMLKGVSAGYVKELNLVGVGYRASTSSNTLEMNLGYSHPIKYQIPKGVSAKVNANTNIVLESADKQLLGQVCAEIRKYRPPEPYKGKGILFKDEKLKRKAGKAGKV
jgi:large subunit ribosomal protein L6